MSLPLVSIIAVNYKQPEVTCDMLDSLRELAYSPREVILVDNGAEHNDQALYEAHYSGLLYLQSQDNVGFAGGNNLAIPKAQGKYILLLNNDTIVPSGFLEPLVSAMEADSSIGIASPKIYYDGQPGLLQYAGSEAINRFTGRGRNLANQKYDDGCFNVSGPTGLAHGACMLIRRDVLEQIGLLSERYFMYYEEIDFCDRASHNGWQCYFVAESHIFHRESASMGKGNSRKTYYLFRNRWLFMRLRKQGWAYYFFVLYFLCLGAPKHILKFWIKKEGGHAKAILQGLLWNIRNFQLHKYERVA